MKDTKRTVLVIDDDEVIHSLLKRRFNIEGYEFFFVSTAEAALARLNSNFKIDLILTDLKMPRMDGIELLGILKAKFEEIPVILMTAHASLETALVAMRAGAFDYVLKPLNLEELALSVEKAIRFRQLEKDNSSLRTQVQQKWRNYEILGKSKAMQTVFDLLDRVAPTQANVLIMGESGTGKELIARALHSKSARNNGPFVAINCSAIPVDLLESELFGHVKGAFTGAHQTKIGLFEEADHGTLFLDEIGDMDLALQAKLLRVVQEKVIRPVGGVATKDINVRIVAATHRDLKAAIKNSQFREDLYYRLCVIPIELPSLRQRKEDIPILANHFLGKHAATHGLNVKGFTEDALSHLLAYHWPGNVRELENSIERAVILTRSERIQPSDLPTLTETSDFGEFLKEKASEWKSLDEIIKVYISLVLDKTDGKKEKAAQVLGIDRKTLRKKIVEFKLDESSESSLEDDEIVQTETSESSSQSENFLN